MAYEKQQWRDYPDQTTPITAARLDHLETQYDEALAASVSRTAAEGRQVYVRLSTGDPSGVYYSSTVTSGNIVQRSGTQVLVPETPTANNHATSKKYVDDLSGSAIPRLQEPNQVYTSGSNGEVIGVPASSSPEGDGFVRRSSGQIFVPQTPLQDTHSASKRYVDDAVAAGGGGGSGVSKAYVDEQDDAIRNSIPRVSGVNQVYTSTDTSGGVTGIPLSSAVVANNVVRRSGQHVLVPVTPTSNDHAASKKYVDDADEVLRTAINTVSSTAAAVDDLTGTFYLPNVRVGTSATVDVSSAIVSTMWVAPFPLTITSMVLVFEYWNRSANASNYWQFTVRKADDAAANPVTITTKSTSSSGGEGVSARVKWSMTNGINSNNTLATGQHLQIQFHGMTGSPGAIELPMLANWTYRPVR